MKLGFFTLIGAAVAVAPGLAIAQTPATQMEMDLIHTAPLAFAALLLTLGGLAALDRKRSEAGPVIGPMMRFAVRFIPRHWKAAPGPLVPMLAGALWSAAAQAEDPEGGRLVSR